MHRKSRSTSASTKNSPRKPDPIDEKLKPVWKAFKKDIKDILYDSQNVAINKLSEDDWTYLQAKVNTKFHKFVQNALDEFVSICCEKKLIWPKDNYPYTRSWIVNDPKIQQVLKSYPKLLDVLHFIDSQGKHDDTIEDDELKSFTVRRKDGSKEERLYSHLIVNNLFFEKAEQKLGLKRITMQKYLQKFSEAGIIRKMKRLQTHGGAMVYLDGFYMQVDIIGHIKKIRFLKQKDHMKFLQDFSY